MKDEGILFVSHYMEKSMTTVVLLFVVSILLHALFLTTYGFFSNDFFRFYPYVIAIISILCFVSAFLVKERALRVSFAIGVVVSLLYLAVFVLFSLWLGGLARAFSNG